MKVTSIALKLLAGLMVASIAMAPGMALAQGHGHDRGHDEHHDRGHDEHHDRGHKEIRHVTTRRVVVQHNVHVRRPNPPVYIGRSHAYDYLKRESDHRQATKNEWRNIAIAAGAVGLIGALQHDNTLAFVGAAGALYSLNRYEQDRKSQSRTDRLRADYFSRSYFVRDGHRYDRRIVTKGGQRYYQFYRH